MKRFLYLMLIIPILLGGILLSHSARAQAVFDETIDYKSAVLIDMDSEKILVSDNENERLPIASVTKLMTVLITLENIQDGNISIEDDVFVSENAHGMGGSQIFLDANENYKLGELLKSIIVCSANDSSVAIAEYIAGSENNFVQLMNEKANELNLKNTHYSNCTGLPTVDGYSSAYDQAIVLKHVLSHDLYHTYSSIWMEDFAHPNNRTTMMTNTNKLSKFYPGCIGGKTGSTNQAKSCLAVGARRENTSMIAVVLGVDTSKNRFKLASDLLNYGFANFEHKQVFSSQDLLGKSIQIKGLDKSIKIVAEKEYSIICKKGEEPIISLNYNLPSKLTKVSLGQIVGNVEISIDGVVTETINLLSAESCDEASILDYIKSITK